MMPKKKKTIKNTVYGIVVLLLMKSEILPPAKRGGNRPFCPVSNTARARHCVPSQEGSRFSRNNSHRLFSLRERERVVGWEMSGEGAGTEQ